MASLYHASVNISNLEQLAMQKSIIHKIHPMAKLISAIVYIVVVISFSYKNITGLVPFIFYPVILISLANIPYKFLLKRTVIALPFSLMAGISNIIFMPFTDGMISFVAVMLKTFLTVFAALILIATTPFTEITHQLNILRIPKILCLLIVMTYRYLSVLMTEAFIMHTAYILRSHKQNGIKLKDIGFFLGQLVLKSFDRAERVYNSMKCRGFDGTYYGKYSGMRISDIVYIVVVAGLAIFLRVFNLSLFIGGII
ncbi:MAG: cobalt ECF transporter T component CbiQ [Oscillospiraceae bacterium]|nr:cobalt ECF transporter T component CbiQ [Oscillospiraceae bacterium]